MKKARSLLVVFFIVAVAAAIIVRYTQLIGKVIDFNTGFFYHYAGALKYLHYIALGAAFIGFIILAIIEKKRRTLFFSKRLGHFDETDTAICGIMLLIAGFAVVYSAFTEGFDKLSYIEILYVIIGTLAYGFAGGILLFKKRAYPSVGLAFLALSGYYVVRLVMLFVENYIILNMPEHLVRLVIALLFSLFYLSAGRMFMRAESKGTRMKACVFGFFGATIAVSEITAKLIFLFGSPSVTRDNLMRSAATKFISPDMLSVAETIALVTFLLTMTRLKAERIKAGKK